MVDILRVMAVRTVDRYDSIKKDALEGTKEALGIRRLVSLGVVEVWIGLQNCARIRTERSKLSIQLSITASEELEGVQIKDMPRERTSCSVSVRILELRL